MNSARNLAIFNAGLQANVLFALDSVLITLRLMTSTMILQLIAMAQTLALPIG